jgi:hypothetical protein
MRIVRRNSNLIRETGAQPLNCANGRVVVRIASNDNLPGNGSNKWRNGAARVERERVATERLKNLESDVPGAEANVLSISDSKIDVTNVCAVCTQDAEMIRRDKAAHRIAWNDLDKPQSHLSKRQCFRRHRERVNGGRL